MTRASGPGALAALLVMAAIATTSAPARAGGATDAAAAQVLFEAGRALVRAKRFSEACPKFVESLRLDRGLGTMLWLADCYEHNGQSASAWAQFKEAAAAAALLKDAREEVARRRASALEPRLSKLQFEVPPVGLVPGLEVRRDGVLVGVSELTLPVPVDPGIHTVAAIAPGRKAWSSNVEVPTRPGLLSVTVPVLDVEIAPLPAEGPPRSFPPSAPAPLHEPSHWDTRRTVAVATAGAGVVAIGIASYLGLHAKSIYDGVAGECPANQCTPTAKQTRLDAYDDATASTVLFGVGGAAIAAAAVVYLTAPHAVSRVGVAPAIGPGTAGLLLTRAF